MGNDTKPADEVRNSLTKMAPQFKMSLPAHIPVEKFLRVAQTAITMNPNLLKADRQSLFAACMLLSQQGLMADGKEAALVPFGDKVTAMPMLAGLLKKARQSGEIASIFSEIVYECDRFKYWIDSEGPHIEHEPLMFGDRGKMIGSYAFAKTKDSASYIEVLSMADIEAIKKSSRSANIAGSPWMTFPSEMIKKISLRRLLKRLPSSTDLDGINKLDDELYDFKEKEVVEIIDKPEEQKQIAPKVKQKSKLERVVEATNVTKQQTTEKEVEPRNEVGESELPL
jgi:recombination protein RecT